MRERTPKNRKLRKLRARHEIVVTCLARRDFARLRGFRGPDQEAFLRLDEREIMPARGEPHLVRSEAEPS